MATKPRAEATEATRPSAARSVLLVEDDADARMLLRIGLSKRRLHVVEADSVDRARDMVQAHHVDFIITDWQLPDGDAADLREAVDAQRRLPAVLLTGFGETAVRERARMAGYQHLLVKPVKIGDLMEAVDRAVGAGRVRERV